VWFCTRYGKQIVADLIFHFYDYEIQLHCSQKNIKLKLEYKTKLLFGFYISENKYYDLFGCYLADKAIIQQHQFF